MTASARWSRLSALGAQPQRLLWASTSTKNPRYRDVMYVEELIGPDTVDTMPPATFEAFREHGRVRPTLEADVEGARRAMAELADLGISITQVTDGCSPRACASSRSLSRSSSPPSTGGGRPGRGWAPRRPEARFGEREALRQAFARLALSAAPGGGRPGRFWAGPAPLTFASPACVHNIGPPDVGSATGQVPGLSSPRRSNRRGGIDHARGAIVRRRHGGAA